MNQTCPNLRQASAADVRAYTTGHAVDPAWAPFFRDWRGYVAERDGRPLGLGVVSLDREGRVWAWVNIREQLPAAMVHRNAAKMLALLRQAGAEEVRRA